jgi:integrase
MPRNVRRTRAQVLELAKRIDRRFRALVLLATFTSLRWGELTALRRCDINLTARTVTVRAQHVELDSGRVLTGPPKSRAGLRTVSFPQAIVPALREHLDAYTAAGDDCLVFTGSRGGLLRRSNFRRAAKWGELTAALGMPGLHFHDLRHTGNTFAAGTKASLRDLMARMGHDSVRAAMIYQHATSEADHAIAAALDAQLGPGDRSGQSDDDNGTGGALADAG